MNRYLCKRENFPNKPAGHSIETKPNFRNEKLFSPLQPESFGQLANQEGERERAEKRQFEASFHFSVPIPSQILN